MGIVAVRSDTLGLCRTGFITRKCYLMNWVSFHSAERTDVKNRCLSVLKPASEFGVSRLRRAPVFQMPFITNQYDKRETFYCS